LNTGDSVLIMGSDIAMYNGSNSTHSGNGAIPQNVWFHVALVRYSSTLSKLFVNGKHVASDTVVSYNSQSSRPLAIGGEVLTNAGDNFAGYITQFRVVKGLAVYTSDFSTAINPLTAKQDHSLGTLSITGNETVMLLSVADSGHLTTDSGNGSAKSITTTGTYSGDSPSTQSYNGKMKQRSTGELLVANEFDEYNTAALQ